MACLFNIGRQRPQTRRDAKTHKKSDPISDRNSRSAAATKERRSKCERCGRFGHSADQCFARFQVNGSIVASRYIPEERDPRRTIICGRCGRHHPSAARCYATFDVDGVLMDQQRVAMVNPRRFERGERVQVIQWSALEIIIRSPFSFVPTC